MTRSIQSPQLDSRLRPEARGFVPSEQILVLSARVLCSVYIYVLERDEQRRRHESHFLPICWLENAQGRDASGELSSDKISANRRDKIKPA
jgi:hypothetical protein